MYLNKRSVDFKLYISNKLFVQKKTKDRSKYDNKQKEKKTLLQTVLSKTENKHQIRH
jgi:hypothetical protein